MSAADLIAMGVDVAQQDENCDLIVRVMHQAIISEGEGQGDVMVRAIVRVLRDAANSAVAIEECCDDPERAVLARVRRASQHLTAALAELTS